VKPRYWLFLGLGLALILVPAGVEVFYQHSVRRQAADLIEQVRDSHPDWTSRRVEFWRFGELATDCSPSLVRDGWAWSTAKLGWRSDLLRDYDETIGNSYHCIGLESRVESDKEGYHAFLWSPRRLRFVPFKHGTMCRMPDCPWTPPAGYVR